MTEQNNILKRIKEKIAEGNIAEAERILHRILVDEEFMNFYGRKEIPALWGHVSSISLSTKFMGSPVQTALVDLQRGSVKINPKFLLTNINSFQDLLFIIMHERDHRLLRRVYRVNWRRLKKILDNDQEWVNKIINVVEDAWINASVRTELGLTSTLPESFYCWSEEDASNPGIPTKENPQKSGFDPAKHKVGEPKSGEYAIFTCLSPFVDDDLRYSHEGLYVEARKLRESFGIINKFTRKGHKTAWNYSYKAYRAMLSFPEWYELFCDWLEKHKDELAQPAPGSEHDEDCPQNESNANGGSSQDSEQGQDEGESEEPCTCNGGEGLLSKPQTLKERLARIPDIVKSVDEKEGQSAEEAEKEESYKDPEGQDEDIDIDVYKEGKGASWGGRLARTEIIPKEVQNLSEIDRDLLEIGGSALTESWRTNTVQIKGAIKKFADELVQDIATMRVTEHKIVRPDFNMPTRPSRKDMMRMGMGDIPVMWDTPQYIEQNELVVYTDVSGSMFYWYSVALYITQQLQEFGCEMYQFSTVVVKPIPGVDDNVFIGTGGTHFPAVAEHIVDNGFKAVIVITDNQDSLEDVKAGEDRNKWIDAMKEIDELYALFLLPGKRPENIDNKNYAFGGNWGRKGWQLCTDKITAIFMEDVE